MTFCAGETTHSSFIFTLFCEYKMTRTISGRWMQFVKAIALPLLMSSLLASCASLIGPRQIELPLTRLQEGLDRRFPVNHRILPTFDIQLARPQLMILPNQGRVSLTIDAAISPPLIQQSWNGSLAISGRLSIDAARRTICISNATVDRFVFDGVDEPRQRLIAKVANVIADKEVKNLPLFSFRPEDLQFAGVQFVPTTILTTPTALVVTLEPVR